MRCGAVRHNTMNVMRGCSYRSKMACTPAMAFRLFSSLEGVGLSAGPGAGMAAAAAASGRSREKQTFKTKFPFGPVHYPSSANYLIFPVTTAVARSALDRDERTCVTPPVGNAEVPRSRIRPGEVLLIMDGPGSCEGEGATRSLVRVTRVLPTHPGAQARPAVPPPHQQQGSESNFLGLGFLDLAWLAWPGLTAAGTITTRPPWSSR